MSAEAESRARRIKRYYDLPIGRFPERNKDTACRLLADDVLALLEALREEQDAVTFLRGELARAKSVGSLENV